MLNRFPLLCVIARGDPKLRLALCRMCHAAAATLRYPACVVSTTSGQAPEQHDWRAVSYYAILSCVKPCFSLHEVGVITQVPAFLC